MKRCPHCNDISSYGDWEEFCPVCNTRLIPIHSDNGAFSDFDTDYVSPARLITPIAEAEEEDDEVTSGAQEIPAFENNGTYRGRITYVHSQSRFHSRLKKIIFALLRGEPYQFGNTSHETLFRLAEFTPGHISGRERNFIFYGDVEGRFDIGDDVTVRAKVRGDRHIVRSFYSNSTESYVRPKPQLPAWFIWLLFALIIGLGVALVYSGLAMKIVTYIIIIIGGLSLVTGRRGIFRRRGRFW